MKGWIKPISEMWACTEAIEWAENYDSLSEAWVACERADWMLWLIGETIAKDTDRKPLVLIACKYARLALPYVPEGEKRPLKAIEAAEAWVRGEATIEKVRAAGADAAAYAAAAYAAYAEAAGGAAARLTTLSQCVDIVREYYKSPPIKEAKSHGK